MHSTEVDRAAIGVVRKPHGIKGGLKVSLYSIDLDTLQSLEQLFVNTGNKWEQLSMKSCQGYDDFSIINFNEIKDRTEAEAYRDLEIYTDREALPELEDGEFYIEDLVGCGVVDEHNKSLGKVAEVITTGAHEVLVVKQGDSEILVPLVDEWVTAIDIKAERIQVITAEEIE